MAADASALLDEFLGVVAAKGLSLYPAQEEAILALFDGANVILNTPTGSGKSLVAQALHFLSLKTGKRSYYTCPIKALVNEKFLALCQDFGPEQVGMITGDASVNPDAPILCCTAEILSNLALREGDRAKVHDVIMDEFHYYSDRERGVAWQVPLLTLPQTRFLLMSATLGDVAFFEKELTRLNGLETITVRSAQRPVPLEFTYQEIPLHETIAKFVAEGKAPIYLVNFTQRECVEEAQNLMSVDFCTKDEKKLIAEALEGTRFDSPYGKDISRFLRHGIGVHHAGLLPKYRVLVEKLAQRGLLKVISGTDTLGVGVNIPIRTVLFTKLCKYDGQKATILSVRDFHQIAGRAGRKGFDDRGFVAVQAPEHVVENLRLEQKAAQTGKKFVKRKPPEKGFVPWTEHTFRTLLESQPEALSSRFQLTHGMLLNLLGRQFEDGCRVTQKLIRDSHEPPASKKKLRKLGFELFRSLVDRRIVEFAVTSTARKRIELNVDLQEDFSLNHALSLYLVDTLALLDPNDPEHALNALTLVESILENPDLILRKQVDRLKDQKMAEMKMEGLEYEQRMEELEKIEHPKPLREFVYDTFNKFAEQHPWVGTENIRPKSVARQIFEGAYSFADYVREYELQRAEGVLLRYLSQAYKVLVQTIPEASKTEGIEEITAFFGAILRATDSSLLEEWENLRNPGRPKAQRPETPAEPEKLSERALRLLAKNAVFLLLRALAKGDREAAAAQATVADPEALAASMQRYFEEQKYLDISPKARAPGLLKIETRGNLWILEQTLSDEEGPAPWVLRLEMDLAATRDKREAVLKLLELASI
jgi:superfamily II RNA helicase